MTNRKNIKNVSKQMAKSIFIFAANFKSYLSKLKCNKNGNT